MWVAFQVAAMVAGLLLLLYRYAFRLVAPSDAERRTMATRALPDVLTDRTGLELAAMIRHPISSGWTSRRLCEAHIEQQKRVNGVINAVVDTRYDEALREADKADAEVAACRGDEAKLAALPIYHGVPCSIKECFALTGMSHTAGLVSRMGKPAKEDATAVARMRKAGLIPLGVTNTSELCMWMESSNKAFGTTRNPYNSRHIVGGSSGGEGCIISACGAPLGLGSDIGGSIRMPAFFNGVFGHKPTGGMVPGTGQFPISDPGNALRYLTSGPIARHCDDLFPLLNIIAGPDGFDQECSSIPLSSPDTVDLSKITVLNISNPRFLTSFGPSNDLKRAQQAAFDHLRSVCADNSRDVEIHEIRKLRSGLDIWSSMLQSSQTTSFATLMEVDNEWKELGKWFLGKSAHTLPALGLIFLERITALMPGRQRRFVETGNELREELVNLLRLVEDGGHEGGRHAVILFPPYASTAPCHHQPLLPPLNWVYTAIWNTMELPVTQVPLGLSPETGLPVGIQVVGLHGHDHVTIRVAEELERKFGGWVHR